MLGIYLPRFVFSHCSRKHMAHLLSATVTRLMHYLTQPGGLSTKLMSKCGACHAFVHRIMLKSTAPPATGGLVLQRKRSEYGSRSFPLLLPPLAVTSEYG